MQRYAVYRILYGEDFIQESIKSISEHVDKIFIFWTNNVLGNCTEVFYKKQTIKFPQPIDNVLNKIQELNNNKVLLIEDYVENNTNQFTHLVNDLILPNYSKPETIIFIEPDHVFHENQIEAAFETFEKTNKLHISTSQIELWKTPHYYIPQRVRPSTIFWNLKEIDEIPPTKRHANINGMQYMAPFVYNLGFCVSKRSMYWKHLTAIAFSKTLGESIPGENWYEEKWLNWDLESNNRNLEISQGYEHSIPYAKPYDTDKLPQIIKDKLYSFKH